MTIARTTGLQRAAAKAVAAAAACLAIAASAGCGAANADGSGEQATIRVAYLSTANYLTTLKDEDFVKDTMAPYAAEFSGPFNVPSEAQQAVLSGNADTTSTGTGHFIKLAAEEVPWVAYAIEYYTGDSQGIVAAPGTGIESVADLKGKRIGIDKKGATGDYIVHAALEAAGMSADDVEEVELSQNDFSAAFQSGQIDALASYDQNLAAGIATEGSRLLVTGDQYGSKNVSIHIVSKAFADEHPEVVVKMYESLKAEADKAAEDPSLIYDAYAGFGASEGIMDVIKGFSVPTILPVDADGRAMLDELARQYVDFGFIDEAPDLDDYVMDCTA